MNEKLKLFLILYPVVLSIIGFISMGADKKRARKNQWRIKESTLFLIAALGGSIGSILGMQFFRHKTKHKQFVYGMPSILIIQILLIVIITKYWK